MEKWKTAVKDLWDRLTAIRAGYLDELASANLPADVDTIKNGMLFSADLNNISPSLITVVSATNAKHYSDSEVSSNALAYTLVKSITIRRNIAACRVVYQQACPLYDPGSESFSRVYVNGVAVGAEHELMQAAYFGWSDDLTGLVPGDVVQIYAYCLNASHPVNIKEFRICYDFTLETNAAKIPAAVISRKVCPIVMNKKLSIDDSAANKDFTATNTLAAIGLPTTNDTKVVGTQVWIVGRVENTYAGANSLDCATATDNQWQIDLDNGGYTDLVNNAADGQMLDGDWNIGIQYGQTVFSYLFNTTTKITNIDGKIGIRLENGVSHFHTLEVTCDVFLIIDYKNV